MSKTVVLGADSIVAFANDWATDPTSKHHLMGRLSKEIDLLWVESSGMRTPSARSGRDLRRIGAKVRRILGGGGLRLERPGLSVLSPPALPFPTNALARAINARLYGRAVRRALRASGHSTPPLLWVYTPTVARYLDHIPHSGLVYHCVDRWWAFDDYDPAEMRACHEILCRRADHVFASALELEADCLAFTNAVSYVPHGVDWAHFRTAVEADLPRPADLPTDGHPIVGFIGLIDHWIDLPLLQALARRIAPAHLVMVGQTRVDVSALAAEPNVHMLGRKSFADLPAYCRAFDVALVPFLVNDLTRAVNPIKLREYLSAGLPVVSTPLPEILPFADRPGTTIHEDHDQFIEAVRLELRAGRAIGQRRALSDAMREESWEGRLAAMLSVLKATQSPEAA